MPSLVGSEMCIRDSDKAIALWPQLEGYLQQGIFERADWEASLQGLERIFPTVS